jgi:hypothetical protein
MSEQPNIPTPEYHPNALLLELTFNDHGHLIVRIPDSMSQRGGKVTLSPGSVEAQLRNILDVENKIKKHEAAFYGEPGVRDLARDLKAGRIKTTRIEKSTAPLELDLDL